MPRRLLYLAPATLSLAELTAAQLDGDTVAVGEGFFPADTAENPEMRASSIAHLVPMGAAAMGPTSVWLLGFCAAPPGQHHFVRTSHKRLRPPAQSRLQLHETPVAPEDLLQIGPVQSTTSLRTMCDLVRLGEKHPYFIRYARLLAQAQPKLIFRAERIIRGLVRTPGKNFALAVLSELGDQQGTMTT